MSENFTAMQTDLSGLISDPNAGWGKRCIVQRRSTSQSASGRASGTYAAVASGTFIIEPYSNKGRGSGSGHQDYGFKDASSHTIYARYGVNVQSEDRIYASGESYWYDVESVNPVNGIMYEIFARQVKRS